MHAIEILHSTGGQAPAAECSLKALRLLQGTSLRHRRPELGSCGGMRCCGFPSHLKAAVRAGASASLRDSHSRLHGLHPPQPVHCPTATGRTLLGCSATRCQQQAARGMHSRQRLWGLCFANTGGGGGTLMSSWV